MITVILRTDKLVKTRNGYIYNLGDGTITQTCKTLREASVAVTRYIQETGIGASTFTGGDLFINGQSAGRVSYNGRVWNVNEAEYSDTELDRVYA